MSAAAEPLPIKVVAVALPPKPQPVILSVQVEGCRISLPMLHRETVDNAVWRCLTMFHYNPRAYKGWCMVPASKGCIAVRVS